MNLEKIEHFTATRSFSRKVNLGNYESADHFASFTAIIKPGATEEEIKSISDELAELSEDAVESKINPSKIVSRRVTMAELKTKLAQQEKRITELEKLNNNQSAF